jgi:dihydropteroate synthase
MDTISKTADDISRAPISPKLLVRGKDILRDRPFLLVGILNLTPDSFSDGGRFTDVTAALDHAIRMARDGADILDLGAESSRPGSDPVPAEEELRRLLSVLEAVHRELPDVPLSVDTSKASVARAALDAGADIVNDISAGRWDTEMLPLVALRGAPVVLMHMRGSPQTMQREPHYADPVGEVVVELGERIQAAEASGIAPGSIVVDPGFGFGKRPSDNLALLSGLDALATLGYPVMVGLSRKSLIGHLTGAAVGDRLPGTLALHTAAFLRGARLFRVHDVAEHRQALRCAAAGMAAGK